jgi:hypothetical protein
VDGAVQPKPKEETANLSIGTRARCPLHRLERVLGD